MASHYFASHRGGVEIVAEHLFRQWTAAGHEVVWMAGNSTPPPEPEGKSRAVPLPVWNFVERKTGVPFPIPTLSALRMIRTKVKYAEVLIVHDCLYLTNMFAFLNARRARVPVLLVQHTRFSPRKNRLLNFIMKLSTAIVARPMLANANQVIFVSEATRLSFAQVHFRRAPETIFNGVDTSLYRPLAVNESKAELRKSLDLPEDHAIILFVGRFVEIKGLAILKEMSASRKDYIWVFAGWGPMDPRTWGAPNVRVFSGLRRESLARLYRASDVLVLPSIGEGFPLVIQEALASGIPVVSSSDTLSADPGLKNFVTSVKTKPYEDTQTAEAFLAATDRTLTSETSRPDGPQQRRAFAQLRYSWQHTAERYLEVASELISAKSTAALPAVLSRGTSR